MRYAFHYVDTGTGWDEYDGALLRGMLALPRRNFVICRGNVVDWNFGQGVEEIRQNALDLRAGAVGTIDADGYIELVTTARPYVQLVQGLTPTQATAIHSSLEPLDDYVGMLGLRFDDRLQWTVYRLPDTYRLVGSELRVRWRSFDGEEAEVVMKQTCQMWKRLDLFEAVAFEDVGVRATVFDAFDTPEHAAIEANALVMLEDLLAGVANHVVLRAVDLDPRLVDGLHAALSSLGTARTSEELAQAAVACRRFLERFADRVFPPTCELRNGRKLGAAEWKNRLWAYAEDALGAAGAAGLADHLKDIGARIDWVVDAANAGVHRPEVEEIAITRLVVGLASLVFDLCLISPPPHTLPDAGYRAHAMAMIRKMVSSDEPGRE